MISEHATEWLGYPVIPYDPGEPVADYRQTVYRIHTDWDNAIPIQERFARFLADPRSAETPAIIFGQFRGEDSIDETTQGLVEALVAARSRLPALRGIFLGDILSEENEISWINQSDVAPLFGAYPQLEHFRVRGGNGLVLGPLRHAHLQSLVIESGGLGRQVLRDVLRSELPALTHLELWLGTGDYGWDGTLEDLVPLLEGQLFPGLRHLGLRDSELQDEIAAALAGSPLLARLSTLDLSLGTLSDEGAVHLLTCPEVRRLQKLDLHHHYLSDGMLARFAAAGLTQVDLSEQQRPHEFAGREERYVAVGE